MVESEADQLPEDVMLGAVVYGHEQMKSAIDAINRLVEKAGKPEWEWSPEPQDQAVVAKITELAHASFEEAYKLRDKQARSSRLKEIYASVEAKLAEQV